MDCGKIRIAAIVACGIPTIFAASVPKTPRPTSQTAPVPSVRTVDYSPDEPVSVHVRLRYATVLQLPEHEEVMDVVCGDGGDSEHSGRWLINGAKGTGLVYVKATAAGASTNLTVVSARGNAYLFMLSESSRTPPDLRVSLRADRKTIDQSPIRFVPAQLADEYRQQAEESKAALAHAREDFERDRSTAEKKATEDIAKARADAPGSLQFDYRFDHGRRNKEFHLEAIASDGKHTYLWLNDPPETPALYEKRDGKPNLVTFVYDRGLFRVDKVLDEGFLSVGKHKLAFHRSER